MKKIQMVDLQTQYKFIKDKVDSSVLEVMQNGTFINGPSVSEFQGNLETYLNVKHVIPCANGTDALQIALMSLERMRWSISLSCCQPGLLHRSSEASQQPQHFQQPFHS